MKKLRARTAIVLCLISAVLLVFSPAAISEESKSLFVDLDGDGFDDNVSDANNDGIPEFSAAATMSEAREENPSSETGALADFSFGSAAIDDGQSFSAQFKGLQFTARSLSRNRCSLDTDAGFGPGNGTGVGSTSGGMVCVGGVCHPR